MLQNPSKYHPNPFSHLLALHSSQAVVNNNINGIGNHHQTHLSALPPVFAAQSQLQQLQQHQQLQQQQQQQQHYHNHHSTVFVANQQHNNNNNNTFLVQNQPPHRQQQLQSNHHPLLNVTTTTTQAHPQELLDTTNTSLDMGKSFTIAAILGLQKSAMENSHKDYHNAINLSLNSSSNEDGSKETYVGRSIRNNQQNVSDDEADNNEEQSQHLQLPNAGNGGGDESGLKSLKCHRNNSSLYHQNANHFDCNGNASAALIHRYLPLPVSTKPATAATSPFVAAATAATQHHHQQQQQQHQNLLLSHVRSVASAAVAASSGTSSALQSLQQLHHHHAQQSSSNLQREKHKSDNSKKTSLKNKRVRTIFTPEQLERLEAEFERQQYMVGPERLYLAHTLQLTEAQVKVWFQNRRIKWRKHHLEITQQRLALLRQTQLPGTTEQMGSGGVAMGAATLTGNSVLPNIDNVNSNNDARTSSPISCGAEDADELSKHGEECHSLSRGSHSSSESDLSICNDSIDAGSAVDGIEDT